MKTCGYNKYNHVNLQLSITDKWFSKEASAIGITVTRQAISDTVAYQFIAQRSSTARIDQRQITTNSASLVVMYRARKDEDLRPVKVLAFHTVTCVNMAADHVQQVWT